MAIGPYAYELKKSPKEDWLVDGENILFESTKALFENKSEVGIKSFNRHNITDARVKSSIFIATDKRFFGLKKEGIMGNNYLPTELYTMAKKNISTANASFFVYDYQFEEKLNNDVKMHIIPSIEQALDVFNNKSIFGKHRQLKNDEYDKITPNKWYPLTWKIITKAELQKGGMLKNKSGILFDFEIVISAAYIEYRNKILSENPKLDKFFNAIEDTEKVSLLGKLSFTIGKMVGIQLTLDNDEYVNLLFERMSKFIDKTSKA
jgi:hypothetical protein